MNRSLVIPRLPTFIVPFARTVVVVFAALLLTLGLLGVSGYNLASCLEALWDGTFGSRYGWGAVLTGSTPLMLTGLAVAVAFRCGALNIGAEGQLLVGTLMATWLGVSVDLPSWVMVPSLFACGLIGGAVWAGIAGGLRVWRGVPEVLSTILLNFVAVELVKFAVTGPLEGVPGTAQTDELPKSAMLLMLDRTTDLHVGIIVAVALSITLYVVITRTTFGFRLRAVGSNPLASTYAGIPASRSLMETMLLSGCLAGLAGAIEMMGRIGTLSQGFTTVGYGYTAIAVAMLARLNPLGVIASAVFFAALASGSREMTFAPNNVPDKLVEIVRGLVVLLAIGYGVVQLRSQKD
ncbi:MAG: ABC transporter permease [Candidatus Poribacteria bacterium]|nr:ABC transporter permease [Candidatus Poribacteria bacterium]